jgi:hypothetical protein
MPETDPLPKLIKDYDDATLLEGLATNPKDKKRFNAMRNFLLLAMTVVIGEVVWH